MRQVAPGSPSRHVSWRSTSNGNDLTRPDDSGRRTSSTPPRTSRSRPCATFCPEGRITSLISSDSSWVAEEGLAMLGVGGGLYLVGVSKPDVEISLNIFGAIGGQKRVVGVNFGSTNAKRDIPIYAELYLQGRMNLDDLVSKRTALHNVNDGYAALKDGSTNRGAPTSFRPRLLS